MHKIMQAVILKLLPRLAVPVGFVGGIVTIMPFSEVFTKVNVPKLLMASSPLSEPSMPFVRR